MTAWSAHRVGRRWLLTQTGRGVVAVAVLSVAACSDPGDSGGSASESTTEADEPSETPTESEPATATGELAWSRVNLGFVSAYVLVRGREAAVVDTGVGGSLDAIVDVLDEAGPGVSGVRHVVLTRHRITQAASARSWPRRRRQQGTSGRPTCPRWTPRNGSPR